MDHLKKIFSDSFERENFKLDIIQDPQVKSFHLGSLESINEAMALGYLFLKKDINKAKNCYYRAARVGEYTTKFYDERLEYSIFKICYALLSDDKETIEAYMDLENPIMNKKFIGYYIIRAIQNVLKNNLLELEINIEGLKKETDKKKYKSFLGYFDFFEGILNKNNEKINNALLKLADTQSKRESVSSITKKLISLDTLALAKLAIIKGFEINILHDLVPIELLPIQPLKKYVGYDFFDELKNEPEI